MPPPHRLRGRGCRATRYTEVVVRHPGARIDVVAHSAGTYLLGEALRRTPDMRFDHAVLLGSVLPVDFPWKQLHERGQIKAVRNDRATSDFVALFFGSVLPAFGATAVGPSGARGFQEPVEYLDQETMYPGGHSAAVEARRLPSYAEYLESGVSPVRKFSYAASFTSSVAPSDGLMVLARLAPWLAWMGVIGMLGAAVVWVRSAPKTWRARALMLGGAAFVAFVALDIL